MSDSLSAGLYHISYVQFIAPDVPPVRRSLGLSNGQVVVLPEGVEHSKWLLESVPAPEPGYWLSVDGSYVAPNGNSVVVTPPGAQRHLWFPLRSAPHPPPVGRDMYAIYAGPIEPGRGAWNAPREIQPGPVEVFLEPIGFPFWFQKLEE